MRNHIKTLFVMAVFMLATMAGALGQSNIKQDRDAYEKGWPKDDWYHFLYGHTAYSDSTWFLDINAGDTLATCVYRLWPYQFFEGQALDTAATDSIKLYAKFYAGHSTDTSTFDYIGNLSWRKDGTTATNITADGYYWSMANDFTYPGYRYYYMEIIALTGHRIQTGDNKFRLRGIGHVIF